MTLFRIQKTKNFVLLFFVLAGILLIRNFTKSSNKQSPATPTPTPIPFSLESMFPPSGQDVNDPKLAIQFIFNKPVNTSTTVVTINPSIIYRLSTDSSGKILYVSPIGDWTYNKQYNIVIEARSLENEVITPPIEYLFNAKQIFDSPLLE